AVFVLGTAISANAQLRANSPEDRAYTAIEAEKNTTTKLQLMLDFEKNYPTNEVMPEIYLMIMDAYKEKGDTAKINEFGEKLIRLDPTNVDGLMAVARNYAMAKTNLEKSVTYAQRAVDAIAKKRSTPPPAGYTDAQWKQYLDTLDNSAKGLLTYAK